MDKSKEIECPVGEASDEDSDTESPSSADSAMSDSEAKFTVDDLHRLRRLLILGFTTQYKAKEKYDPTECEELQGVITRMLEEGSDGVADPPGLQVVEEIKDVSLGGRSARQDSLVYALAKCCRCKDIKTRRAAYTAIKDICRTPTQLFLLIKYIENHNEKSGWGRGLRKAVQDWYNSNSVNPMHLAYQMTKYWNRHGWCHRDLCRLSHIKWKKDDVIGFIICYALKGMTEAERKYLEDGYHGDRTLEQVHRYLAAVEEVKGFDESGDIARAEQLISQHKLVREQLPAILLGEKEVWSAMLEDMPLMAMIRNMNKMTKLGLFNDPDKTVVVKKKLSNVEAMREARVHPFNLLLAYHTYKRGRGRKCSLKWTPNPEIQAALEEGCYMSFGAVKPTHKRILIALDISSSMQARVMKSPIKCLQAATLMAMVTVRAEPVCDVVGFQNKLVELDMFKDTSKKLGDLVGEISKLSSGVTDCSKPMTWARHKRKEYDVFIIYTNSDTMDSHRIPPWRALQKYRDQMNIPNAKLIVVGLSSSDFTIARPDDLNMFDVVGFDIDTPGLIRECIMGSFE